VTIEDELARARRDKSESERVTRRLEEARQERVRLGAQLAITEQSRDYEQADVDKLTKGVGGFLRSVLASTEQLTKEHEELAAAQLLCDELSEELRAIDIDIAQLEARHRAVADANDRYANLISQLEWKARARGDHHPELDALAAAEAAIGNAQAEMAELIDLAVSVQDMFRVVVNCVRELHPRHHDDPGGPIPILDALTGRTSRLHSELTQTLAQAQQGLRQFEAAARAMIEMPGDLELQLPPLPESASFMVRDLLWTNSPSLDAVLPEISRISSMLAGYVGEIRARLASAEQALADVARMRAQLLDNSSLYR
jgi:DNA repair exonuclease SbcCD ATPase subunit